MAFASLLVVSATALTIPRLRSRLTVTSETALQISAQLENQPELKPPGTSSLPWCPSRWFRLPRTTCFARKLLWWNEIPVLSYHSRRLVSSRSMNPMVSLASPAKAKSIPKSSRPGLPSSSLCFLEGQTKTLTGGPCEVPGRSAWPRRARAPGPVAAGRSPPLWDAPRPHSAHRCSPGWPLWGRCSRDCCRRRS